MELMEQAERPQAEHEKKNGSTCKVTKNKKGEDKGGEQRSFFFVRREPTNFLFPFFDLFYASYFIPYFLLLLLVLLVLVLLLLLLAV